MLSRKTLYNLPDFCPGKSNTCKGHPMRGGSHLQSCSLGGGTKRRHNRLRDILARGANAAGVTATTEAAHLLSYRGDKSKPGDIVLWDVDNKNVVIDLTIADSYLKDPSPGADDETKRVRACLKSRSMRDPYRITKNAETKKRIKRAKEGDNYSPTMEERVNNIPGGRYVFRPMAMTSSAAHGRSLRDAIAQLISGLIP